MTPKPLTKEESEEIDRLRVMMRGEGGMIGRMQQALEQACAAEMFWRDAVKKHRHDDMGCGFCGHKTLYLGERHKPDCPRLLAQDGE